MSVRFVQGAFVAALCAGPLVAIPTLIGLAMEGPAPTPEALVALPFFLLLSMAVGTMGALVPALALGAILAHVGVRHPRCRRRLAWAATGLAAGTAIGVWFHIGSALGPTSILATASLGFASLIGLVGSICALIGRHFTIWDD